MPNRIPLTHRFGLALILALLFSLAIPPAVAEEAVIDSALGVDDSVDYSSLTKFGPWDDRNYELTAADIALLPENDRMVRGVPAFYKIQKRREMAAEGFPLDRYYPRELDKEFEIRMGGLIVNGELRRTGLGIYTHPDPKNPPPKLRLATDPNAKAVPIQGEGPFDGTASNNETTIEYNPANPNQVIAGSNGSGGQRHSFSSDGGVTWMSAGALPSSCCDPAMEWSPDGSIAYTATLGNATGGGGLQTEIYWSTNAGQTWQGPVNVSTGSSDKEFIHVDRAPGSPHLGQLYATWHQGNVMQFARCNYNNGTNMLDCDPTQSFPGEERGIGSDITTDHLGNIYYFWPSVTNGSTEIRVMVSTDGGTTFGASVSVFDLWGDFDFAVPSMESRRVFIYTAASADRTGGPRNGRVYVTFTDKHPSSPAGPGGAAAANHSWVQLAYSDDQGATWTTAATPHSEADVATVDRYHPWMDVDAVGNVHLGFYDTRNSTNRTGVDWYYVFSPDGGATWLEETRVSAIVSQNINNGQEWGDYNGLSVSTAAAIAMTWTDNRITPPAANPTQSSYAGRVTNVALGPTFIMGAAGTSNISICSGDPLPSIDVTLSGFQGFTDPVTLSTPGIDNGIFPTATFTPNPVAPTAGGAVSTLNVTTDGGAASGSYTIDVEGVSTPDQIEGAGVTRSLSFGVELFAAAPASTALDMPADMATDVDTSTTLTWTPTTDGENYFVELATDAAFTNVVESATVTATSFTPTPLLGQTEYFWRVTASNTCGGGTTSAVRSFTTAALPGDCNIGDQVSAEYDYGFESGASGWTSSGTGDTWAQSGDRVNSGSFSWMAVDPTSVSDQRLVSPSIPLPTDQSPLTLQFFHYRDIEESGETQCWDAGILEISTDSGNTWTQIPNESLLTDPYNGVIRDSPNPLQGLMGYCNLQDWTRSVVDLDAFAGQTAQFRFRVGSDGSVGAEGWFIDDVRVQSCLDESFIYRDGFE